MPVSVVPFTDKLKAVQDAHAEQIRGFVGRIAGEWEDVCNERDARAQAEAKAAEDLLTEAQLRINQKDKEILAVRTMAARDYDFFQKKTREYADAVDGLRKQVKEPEEHARTHIYCFMNGFLIGLVFCAFLWAAAAIKF